MLTPALCRNFACGFEINFNFPLDALCVYQSARRTSQINMATRRPLFIDKLSVTFQVQRSDHQMRVRDVLSGLAGSEEISLASRGSELRKNYAIAYQVIGSNSKTICTVQADPYELRRSAFTGIPPRSERGLRSFMRFEWNPAALNFQEQARLGTLLRTVVPDYSIAMLMTEARVTRIDLSFDIYDVLPDSFLIYTSPLHKTVSVLYKYGAEGRCNAVQIGSVKSDRHLLIYDKRLQLNQKPRPAGRIPILRRARTRFELRLQAPSFQTLSDGPNPFDRYKVASRKLMRTHGFSQHEIGFFLDSCDRRGAQAALSLIENARLRRRYSDALLNSPCPNWWQPSDIWNQLPQVIVHAIPYAELV